MITPNCALCAKTFICDNGMWFTTCNCAKDRPEELRAAQERRNEENLKRSATYRDPDHLNPDKGGNRAK